MADEDEYEDDFEEEEEEYDDDFEDDEPESPAAPPPPPEPKLSPEELERRRLLEALNAENAEAMAKRSTESAPSPEPRRPAQHQHQQQQYLAPVGTSLDPKKLQSAYKMSVPARTSIKGLPTKEQKKLNAEAKRAKERMQKWKDVLALTKINESSSVEMFDLEPMEEREMFQKGWGPYWSKGTKGVQTGAGGCENYSQTDAIDTRSARAQVPEDIGLSRDTIEGETNKTKQRAAEALAKRLAASAGALQSDQWRRLSTFLNRRVGLIDRLLAERSHSLRAIFKRAPPDGGASLASLSADYQLLVFDTLLAGRSVQGLAFGPGEAGGRELILIAYSPLADPGKAQVDAAHLASKGCLCVWDLGQPQKPRAVLLCEGTPLCCAWAPSSSDIVLAGLEEGGVCLWDLREPGGNHRTDALPGHDGVVLRRPTYTTEWCGVEVAPRGGVCALATSALSAGAEGGKGGASRGHFTVCALDSGGSVNVWTVSELSRAVASDLTVDRGLRVGSRVTMMRTGEDVRYGPKRGAAESGMRACDLRALPSEPHAFVVGADGGRCLRGTHFGPGDPPRAHTLVDLGVDPIISPASARAATTLHFSPFVPDFFLAGYEGGGVALYHTSTSLAVAAWEGFSEGDVEAVRWSPSRPSLFFVMDSASTVFGFDLLAPGGHELPVHNERFGGTGTDGTARITKFDVSEPAEALARNAAIEHLMVLAYEDGRVDVHLISTMFVQCGEQDVQQAKDAMHAFLQ